MNNIISKESIVSNNASTKAFGWMKAVNGKDEITISFGRTSIQIDKYKEGFEGALQPSKKELAIILDAAKEYYTDTSKVTIYRYIKSGAGERTKDISDKFDQGTFKWGGYDYADWKEDFRKQSIKNALEVGTLEDENAKAEKRLKELDEILFSVEKLKQERMELNDKVAERNYKIIELKK